MKKSLRPKQTAPVLRQTTAATSSLSPVGVGPTGVGGGLYGAAGWEIPFAGDDAE